MLDLYMKGCNLSATVSFLMDMSSDTLLKVLKALYIDDTSTDPSVAMFFRWHIVTIKEILKVREIFAE